MRKLACLFLLSLLAACGSDRSASVSSGSSTGSASIKSIVTVQSVLSAMEKGRYSEGELLVKFRSGVLAAASLRTHQSVSAIVLKRFTIVPNLEQVKLPEGLSVKDAVVKYMNAPNVEYAEPNYIKHSAATAPNDLLFGQQWGLHNTGQAVNEISGIAGADIKAPQTWDITTGSGTVVVAVLDTGIDYTHPDLAKNVWANPGESCTDGIDHDGNGFINDCRGWDFTTCAKFSQTTGVCITPKSPSNDPMDNNGHGSHVSGIVGAVGNNATGVAGLNWNVRVMPLKILNADGEGSVGDEIAGIDYVVLMKNRGTNITVMNASFAGSEPANSESDAISAANSSGVLLAAAAGNDGTSNDVTPNYPANYSLPNIISVAATDQSDHLASFSNFGHNSVHVAAPGINILSTVPLSLTAPFCLGSPFPGYAFCDGTSMATPFISGLTGLLYSYYSGFTPSQIHGTILRYVDALNLPIVTKGRINAYLALSSLLTPTGLTATSSPSSQVTLNWTDKATGEDGYKVERKGADGVFQEISISPDLGPNTTTFTDAPGVDGTYRVRAFNTIPAYSSYSNEVAVLNAPSNLAAANVTTTSVTVSWTNNSQTSEGVKVQRKSPGSDFAEIGSVGPNVTTFTDTGLTPQTSYTYQVAAFSSSAGNSAFSNTVMVTTSSPSPAPSGGGGGGCSIGAKQNAPTAVADFAVLLMPLLIFALWRRRG